MGATGIHPKVESESCKPERDFSWTVDQAIAVESLPQLPPATPLPPPPPEKEPDIYKHLAKMRAQAVRRASSKKRLEKN